MNSLEGLRQIYQEHGVPHEMSLNPVEWERITEFLRNRASKGQTCTLGEVAEGMGWEIGSEFYPGHFSKSSSPRGDKKRLLEILYHVSYKEFAEKRPLLLSVITLKNKSQSADICKLIEKIDKNANPKEEMEKTFKYWKEAKAL
jgi:hypothetical protein